MHGTAAFTRATGDGFASVGRPCWRHLASVFRHLRHDGASSCLAPVKQHVSARPVATRTRSSSADTEPAGVVAQLGEQPRQLTCRRHGWHNVSGHASSMQQPEHSNDPLLLLLTSAPKPPIAGCRMLWHVNYYTTPLSIQHTCGKPCAVTQRLPSLFSMHCARYKCLLSRQFCSHMAVR